MADSGAELPATEITSPTEPQTPPHISSPSRTEMIPSAEWTGMGGEDSNHVFQITLRRKEYDKSFKDGGNY